MMGLGTEAWVASARASDPTPHTAENREGFRAGPGRLVKASTRRWWSGWGVWGSLRVGRHSTCGNAWASVWEASFRMGGGGGLEAGGGWGWGSRGAFAQQQGTHAARVLRFASASVVPCGRVHRPASRARSLPQPPLSLPPPFALSVGGALCEPLQVLSGGGRSAAVAPPNHGATSQPLRLLPGPARWPLKLASAGPSPCRHVVPAVPRPSGVPASVHKHFRVGVMLRRLLARNPRGGGSGHGR